MLITCEIVRSRECAVQNWGMTLICHQNQGTEIGIGKTESTQTVTTHAIKKVQQNNISSPK